MPLPPGIEMSSTAQLGRRRRRPSRASKAMSAWPTRSTPGRPAIIWASLSRTTVESSTMKTVLICWVLMGEVERGSEVQISLELVGAIRADAVAEADVCTACDVTFDAVPVVAVVANLVAVAAYRQQTLQRFHRGHSLLQLSHPRRQRRLELDHARSDLHAGAQLAVIERFGDVIVRAGMKSFDDVVLAAPRGEQNDVGRLQFVPLASTAANLDAIDAGHEPVQDEHRRRVRLLKRVPGCSAVGRQRDFVAPLDERGLEHAAGDGIVFGGKDSHAA